MKDKKYLDYELDELLEYELISFIKDLIIGIRSADCTRQKVLLTIWNLLTDTKFEMEDKVIQHLNKKTDFTSEVFPCFKKYLLRELEDWEMRFGQHYVNLQKWKEDMNEQK